MNAVALLRGINVGGKHSLPMKELAAMFVAEGCGHVRTYIQSGNVVFTPSAGSYAGLEQRIGRKIAERFGFTCPVILRTARELSETVSGNPFLKSGADLKAIYVYFLADVPSKESLHGLDPARSSPDEYIVRGRDIYAYLVTGAARTKLTNTYFDSKLKTVSTARNWRTVLTLLEMLQVP